MAEVIIAGRILQMNAPTVILRIVGPGAAPITQSQVSAIDYTVANIVTEAMTVGPSATSLTVVDVVSNTLILDDLWGNQDDIGYNFKHAFLTGAIPFPVPGTYQIDYKFTMTSGAAYRCAAQIKTTKIYRST